MIIVCVASNLFRTGGFLPDIDYTFEIHHCKEIGYPISINERDKLSNGGYMLENDYKAGGWGHK